MYEWNECISWDAGQIKMSLTLKSWVGSCHQLVENVVRSLPGLLKHYSSLFKQVYKKDDFER